MSLSPLPDRTTSAMGAPAPSKGPSASVFARAHARAPASACADSIAGMMPSVRLRRAKASIASPSGTGVYEARPVSASHACSGPTPG